MSEPVDVRFVIVRGARYLRAEDVQHLLAELAATEETDTRKRINALVRSIGTNRMNTP